MASRRDFGPGGRRFIEGDPYGPFETPRGQAFDERLWQVREMRLERAASRFQGRVEPRQRTPDETLHFARRAQQVSPSPPFWRDLLRLDRILRETSPRTLLALLGVSPAGLHHRDIGPEIEGQLPMRMGSLSQQNCVHSAPVTAPRSSGSGTVTPVA